MALLVLLLVPFSSCVPRTPEPPNGVWMSENPHIVLYFKPEYQIPIGMPAYLGIYTVDGVEVKIFAHFGNGMQFEIFNLTGLGEDGGASGRVDCCQEPTESGGAKYTMPSPASV